MLMFSGEVTLSSSIGKLIQITLTSHEVVGNVVDNKRVTELFENQLLCRRYELVIYISKNVYKLY